jgi:acetyl esterase
VIRDQRAEKGEGFLLEDVEYLSHGGRPLLGRLCRPVTRGPNPVVISVHGGAWTSGDRMQDWSTYQYLASNGIAVFSVDFRQPPEARYPQPVADINYAVRWLKRNAARFGMDGRRIGGIGFSSGGHQLALNALRPFHEDYRSIEVHGSDPDTTAELDFVVLCYAVLSPLARYEMVTARGIENLISSHHAYWPSVADMEAGDPQLIVERGEAERLPPMLLIQGVVDENLPDGTAERFARAYAAGGGVVETEIYESGPHGFMRLPGSEAAASDARERILRFVRAELAAELELGVSE